MIPAPVPMSLFIRLVRALFVFGLIFSSYVLHLGLLKIFRRIETDPASGRETERIPPWLVRRRDRIDLRNARRLLRGMLRLRGVYIKLGQVLSVMGGFLPAVYAKELEQLQDAVPPHPFDEVEEVFIESLRKKPEDVFRSIETTPIAAASLGQVHVAYLPDGTKCAVKVLYPGIRDVIRVDMRVIRLAIRAYRLFVPVQNIETVHAALVDLLRRETDYVHEANCMERMEANFAGEDDILFPKVFREISTADVLTMSFMEGFKITNLAEIDARGIDRRALATRLTECFYKQMFLHRFFHADPHPGNFLVQAGEAPDKPRIVILDFGAISEVEDRFVDGMIDVLRGFFEQNDALVLAGISDMGFVAPDGDRGARREDGEDLLREAPAHPGEDGRSAHACERERAPEARGSGGRPAGAPSADEVDPLPGRLVLRGARRGDELLAHRADRSRPRHVPDRVPLRDAAARPAHPGGRGRRRERVGGGACATSASIPERLASVSRSRTRRA